MRDRLIRYSSLAVAFLAFGLSGQAQEIVRRAEPARSNTYEAPVATPTASAIPRAILVDPSRRLSVGDQVSIEIVEDREGATSRLITATGDLEVPPLDRVRVAGKTTHEAAGEIKRRLEADYYYHATVKLSIDRVNVAAAMGKIQISGAVGAPQALEFNLADPPTLNEAILKAGNFTQFADAKKVRVTRTRGGQKEEFIINVKAIQRNGEVDKDIKLQDGDRVHVNKTFLRLD